MRNRVLVGLIAAAAAALLTRAELGAQRPAAPSNTRAASKAIPRTADGRPDMQGDWTNATYTPLERPDAFQGKEFFTPEEAAAYEKRRQQDLVDQPVDTHYEDVIWMSEKQVKRLTSLRTSIITQPRDGRIPPLNAEGRRRGAERARNRTDPMVSVQTMDLSDRCIYWPHEGPPILPTGYNSNLRIVQAPQTFVVIPEMMSFARIVPLDGRPRIGDTFKTHRGESRGRWEGDTLVVETAGFNEAREWRGASEAVKVTERFTMVDPDTIRYDFTVDDPKTWDVPWSGEVVVRRLTEPIFEYACHEGNYGLPNILRGQRKTENDASAHERGVLP